MLREEWRPISGFSGYEVSSCGRISSSKSGQPRVLTCKTSREWGYSVVNLSELGRIFTRQVHVLVAEAFIGSRPDGMVTRHLDGNPANNEVSNLVWGTQSENMRDRRLHGTDPNVNKTHCLLGHQYDEANTYVYVGSTYVARHCRTCRRAASCRSKNRKRTAAAAAARQVTS